MQFLLTQEELDGLVGTETNKLILEKEEEIKTLRKTLHTFLNPKAAVIQNNTEFDPLNQKKIISCKYSLEDFEESMRVVLTNIVQRGR